MKSVDVIIKQELIENGEFAMSVSYDKLWKLLIDKKMNRPELKDAAGISFNVLAKMGKTNLSRWKACIRFVQPYSVT